MPSKYNRIGKPVLDRVVAALALVIFAPIIGIVSLVIRFRLGSPVLFRQVRPGRGEQRFEMLKFRTMTDARRPDGTLRSDGERLTPTGRLLRKTSLDELPSLVNVLRGEMSLVGPRPLLVRYLPFFTDAERARFSVRPGITGWAQVQGRNELAWDRRLAHDVWYVEHQSLALDLRILVRTVVAVFQRKGLVVDPGAAMLDLDAERSPRPDAEAPAGAA